MNAIKQNAEGLNPHIQKIGCFFRAACHMAEIAGNKLLTAEQLNQLWRNSKIKGFINSENNVMNSANIANAALEVLNAGGKFSEVAVFENGIVGWYKSIPKEQRKANYFIQKFLQNGINRTHFVNVDRYGKLMWDPHEPAIKKIKVIYTICYRYDEGTK